MKDRRLAAVVAAALIAGVCASAPPAGAETPDGFWVAGDLHIHTTYSHDSYGGPGDDNTGPDEAYTLGHSVASQFAVANARGLDYLAITDHNDIRSLEDFDQAGGVLPIAGYENSLRGHAQMLGATKIYDNGPDTTADVNRIADELRDDGGVFQINHPMEGSVDHPHDPDWGYGDSVVPDTIEVWNISHLWQPPAPSASSNEDAIRYWEGFLDRGHRVGATGGSDNHYIATTPIQGAGQPTTWVFVDELTQAGVLSGLRAGRTFISHQPPAHQGPRVFLESDSDRDGSYESMVGDTVAATDQMRVRVEGAPGALLYVITDGGTEAMEPIPVTSSAFEHRFTSADFSVDGDVTWVRAEIREPDGEAERGAACDGQFGSETTYCRNKLLMLGMTSAIYLEPSDNDPTGSPSPTPTASSSPSGETLYANGTTYARVSTSGVVLGNDLVERRWQRASFSTTAIRDKRGPGRDAAGVGPDFRLDLGPTDMTSTDFDADDLTVDEIDGGLRLRLELSSPALNATRIVDVYEDVAGFRTRTILEPVVALPLFGYTLDEANVGATDRTTIHAFRAGADWRDPEEGWDGPRPDSGDECMQWCPITSVGDPHAGTWRDSRSAVEGGSVAGPAQWISAADGEASTFLVMERNDQPSSRASYDGSSARLVVDLTRDIVSAGPFEEQVHAENPTDAEVGRNRVVPPGETLALEPAFLGLGSHDGDEAWQFHKYLVGHRLNPYDLDVTFNSNGTDDNVISTGAKDDMDHDTVLAVADEARALGVDTFILDDGWQANSGDWQPDCLDADTGEEHRDHRGLYPPRFPDCDFEAVREAIAPMKLGLWMSPMHFNPGSEAYKAHPEWACAPVGHGLAAYNIAEPDSSSNEAGLGMWGPAAIPHIEARIRDAIEHWGVEYFKFDFLVWVDCAGEGDMYDYREAFMAMVDRLQSTHKHVTFQIDETNDYRLFPFESVARGPSWFQNGNPLPPTLLHNLWNLSPYVPAFSLGQGFLGNGRDQYPIDTLMATALPSHMTFFSDLRDVPESVIEEARPWVDFYQANRDVFGHVLYPLLEDPIEKAWTALQTWDPEAGEGALLAFRQDSDDDRKTIALTNVPAGRSFDLYAAPSGEFLRRVTSADLTAGIEILLPEKRMAEVLVIRPAATRTPTHLAYTGDTRGRGSTVTLAARLTDPTGEPLGGRTITFTIAGQTLLAITGPDGIGTTTAEVPDHGKSQHVTATFAGDDRFLPSAIEVDVIWGGKPLR